MIESKGWILGRRSSSFSPRAIPRLSLYRKYQPGFQIIALVGRFRNLLGNRPFHFIRLCPVDREKLGRKRLTGRRV